VHYGTWVPRFWKHMLYQSLHLGSMKSSIFWDITTCNPLKVDGRFGGIFRHHLQGRRISQIKNQRVSSWQAEHASRCFLAWLILRPWSYRRHIPPNRVTFNGLQDVITEKIELFITTGVKSWNPTRRQYVFPKRRNCDNHLWAYNTVFSPRRLQYKPYALCISCFLLWQS
jgi:hypothetical protein